MGSACCRQDGVSTAGAIHRGNSYKKRGSTNGVPVVKGCGAMSSGSVGGEAGKEEEDGSPISVFAPSSYSAAEQPNDDDEDIDTDLTVLNPASPSLKMTVDQFLAKLRGGAVLTTDETYILQEIISNAAKSAHLNFGAPPATTTDNSSFSNSNPNLKFHVPEAIVGPFKPLGKRRTSVGGNNGAAHVTTVKSSEQNDDPNTLMTSLSTPLSKPEACAPPSPLGPLDSIGHISRRSSGAFAGFREREGSRGNSNSNDISGIHEPVSTLTPQEGNQRVKRSWEVTVAYPDCPSLVYRALLSKFPEATEALFYGVNIEKQAGKLVGMITSGIDLLDKPDMFITVMLQLGSRHVLYAVESHHFDMFNVAVFHTIETALLRKEKEIGGDLPAELRWGNVLRGEWTRVLTLMKTVLLQGYATPQGVALAKKQAVRIKTMLNKCWQTVMKAEDDYEESFVYILHNLGRTRIGSERADLFTNLVMRHRHFMQMMTHLFEVGVDDDAAKVMLKELGARHVAYRVEESDFNAHAIPFVEAIKMRADPKTFNPFLRNQLLTFWKKATALMVEGAYESTHSFELRYSPKETPFAMVFTDIESSTSLWEKFPIQMEEAVQHHFRMIRELIHDHHGYEVKTIGDSFMIAFQSLQDAVMLAMRVQVHLMRNPIDDFEMNSTCESTGPDTVWNRRTLRVRIGVHWCTDANPKYDVVHRGYDYYGRDVNAAARIQDKACGGQTVCTEETLTRFRAIARLGEMTSECGDLLTIYPTKTTKEMSFHAQKQKVDDAIEGDFSSSMAGAIAGSASLNASAMSPKGSVLGSVMGSVSGATHKRQKACLNDVFRCTEYKRDVELSGIGQKINLYSIYPAILEDRVYGERKKKVQQENAKNWDELAVDEAHVEVSNAKRNPSLSYSPTLRSQGVV